jgi:NAD(P)-dependent dehydrogenase (short-subunit alcohol dehydrogenase family)
MSATVPPPTPGTPIPGTPTPRTPVPGLLTGRVAVVTGAARGIGREVARALAAAGARVALADVDEAAVSIAAEEIAAELFDPGLADPGPAGAGTGDPARDVRTLAVALDVADPASTARAADTVEATFGLADVVVANAGILVLKPALEITPAEFARVVEVNLTGAFLTATEFARRLVGAGRPGSVILTSSLFGVRGGAGNAAYAASKFGLIGLAESMAADLAPVGIRVNCVCPGQIDSDMLQQLFVDRATQRHTDAAHEQAVFEARIPLGRLGTAAAVADGFVFLASDLSSYVTGQRLVIDGGWSVA